MANEPHEPPLDGRDLILIGLGIAALCVFALLLLLVADWMYPFVPDLG